MPFTLLPLLALSSLAHPAPPSDARAASNRAPSVTVGFPTPGVVTDAATIHVQGTAWDADGVQALLVNGLPATTSDGYATWSANVPLQPGVTSIVVEATDALGNVDRDAATTHVRNVGPLYASAAFAAFDDAGQRVLVSTFDQGLVGIDPSNGVRTVLAPVNDVGGPYTDIVPIAGAHQAYVCDNSSVARIDLATGAKAIVASNTVGTGAILCGLFGLAHDLANGRLFVRSRLGFCADLALLEVDPASGDRSVISGFGAGSGLAFGEISAVAIAPSGSTAFVADPIWRALLAVDLGTGDRVVLSDFEHGTGPRFAEPIDVVYDAANDRLLVHDGELRALFAVDPASGDRTRLSAPDLGGGPGWMPYGGIALDPGSARAYHAANDALLAVDLLTGDRRAVSTNACGTGPAFGWIYDLALRSTSTELLVADLVAGVMRVDPASGDRSWDFGGGLASASFDGLIALDEPRNQAIAIALETAQFAPYVVARDLDDGTRTLLAPLPIEASQCSDVEVDAARAQAYLSVCDAIYAYDLDLHVLAVVSSAQIGQGPALGAATHLAIDPASGAIYAAAGDPYLLRVDPASGDRTAISGSSLGLGPCLTSIAGLEIDVARQVAYVLDRNYRGVLAIDLASGDRSVVSLDAINSGGVVGCDGLPLPPRGEGPVLRAASTLELDVGRDTLYVGDSWGAQPLEFNGVIAIDVASGDRAIRAR